MYPRGTSALEFNFCDFESIEYSTCNDYFKAGFNDSGSYNVYLDGKTYRIHCDFSSGKMKDFHCYLPSYLYR